MSFYFQTYKLSIFSNFALNFQVTFSHRIFPSNNIPIPQETNLILELANIGTSTHTQNNNYPKPQNPLYVLEIIGI
jgi:hypothetical protein